MAWSEGVVEEQHVKTMSGKAGAAINAYTIVMKDTAVNDYITATGGTVTPFGVVGNNGENPTTADENYANNDYLAIKYSGIVFVKAGGTIVRGDRVMSNASGQAIRHVNTDGVWVLGIAMQAASVNDVIPVMIDRFFVGDYTLT